MSIRQCETLAQKLYNQSRDTPSSYRTLTGCLRKLRNVLGDIDEALSDADDTRLNDTKLQPCLVQSKNILEKLDMALVTYRCMSQADVDTEVVAGLKCAIEEATQDLATAYEKLTRTGEISMSACSCMLVRKASHGSKTSSSWSIVNRDTPTDADAPDISDLPTELTKYLRPSDEKEMCRPSCLSLQPSASDINLGGRGTPASWRSISLDPLSKPIADASKMILSSDSPIDVKPSSDLSDTALIGGGHQIVQRYSDKLACLGDDPVQTYVDAVMNGTLEAEDQCRGRCTARDVSTELSGLSTQTSHTPTRAHATSFSTSLLGTLADAHGIDYYETQSDAAVVASTARHARDNNIATQNSSPPSRPSKRDPPPSPRTLRHGRYELMCCATRESPQPAVKRGCLSTGSSEDLYSATPPKKARQAGTGDSNLYPDPLQLTKKLHAVRQQVSPGTPDQADASRLQRSHSILSMSCRRNSVGALAELEGEQVHPPTRSSSCSSLPRYESVMRRSRRARPSRYRRPLGSCENNLTRSHDLRTLDEQNRAASTVVRFAIEKSPAVTRLHPIPTTTNRLPADDAMRLTKPGKDRLRVRFAIRVSDRTWYERDKEDTTAAILDQERIRHIVHYWNERSWDDVEQYLAAHLDEISTDSRDPSSRRAQHLLGACASFRGEWDEAIRRFIKVLRKPIGSVSDLDEGDCAAAHWLGDLYTMQNRRADALVAYSLARHGALFEDEGLQSVIQGECKAVQLGVSKCELKRHWYREALLTIEKGAAPSLLCNEIISMEAARTCLESGTGEQGNQVQRDSTTRVRPRHLHAFLLGDVEKLAMRPELFEHMAMKINVNCLDPNSPWPMPYDPLFCMANVQRGRLLAYECDMLKVFDTNSEAKLPRRLTNFDCFTCNDLTWLITTIRACLKTYETGYSEVVNVQGTWFCCRYSFMQHKIATTHYFSIAVFKHPFRSSYGVEVCSDEGMGSARIMETAGNYRNGVHYQEPKRIKHLIRKFLDDAAKRDHLRKRKASNQSTSICRRPS